MKFVDGLNYRRTSWWLRLRALLIITESLNNQESSWLTGKNLIPSWQVDTKCWSCHLTKKANFRGKWSCTWSGISSGFQVVRELSGTYILGHQHAPNICTPTTSISNFDKEPLTGLRINKVSNSVCSSVGIRLSVRRSKLNFLPTGVDDITLRFAV